MKTRRPSKPKVSICSQCKGRGVDHTEGFKLEMRGQLDYPWPGAVEEYCPNCDGTGVKNIMGELKDFIQFRRDEIQNLEDLRLAVLKMESRTKIKALKWVARNLPSRLDMPMQYKEYTQRELLERVVRIGRRLGIDVGFKKVAG